MTQSTEVISRTHQKDTLGIISWLPGDGRLVDIWTGWKTTFDAASPLAVSRGAAGVEGEASRVAAWRTIGTCYFGVGTMICDTFRNIRNVYIRTRDRYARRTF